MRAHFTISGAKSELCALEATFRKLNFLHKTNPFSLNIRFPGKCEHVQATDTVHPRVNRNVDPRVNRSTDPRVNRSVDQRVNRRADPRVNRSDPFFTLC